MGFIWVARDFLIVIIAINETQHRPETLGFELRFNEDL